MSEAAASGLVRRVVLIDDTAMLRQMVANHLHKTGRYEVVAQASNGLEGIQAVNLWRPDLVLLDLSMPVMDGSTALPQIRALAPGAHIVIFTGHNEKALWPELQQAGAAAAIGKGTKLTEVVELLDSLFTGPDASGSF